MKPAPTSFPEYLGISGWYQIHGVFRYVTDDHSQTTPDKLSSYQEIQEVNFFFEKNCALRGLSHLARRKVGQFIN